MSAETTGVRYTRALPKDQFHTSTVNFLEPSGAYKLVWSALQPMQVVQSESKSSQHKKQALSEMHWHMRT
jgi:hypothetical protein